MNGYEQISNLICQTTTWRTVRARAFQDFQKLGVPTRQHEDWKYLPLQPLADVTWNPTLISQNKGSLQTTSKIATNLSKEFYHLVFMNGFLSPALSNLQELKNEIEIFYLDEVVSGKDVSGEIIMREFERLLKVNTQPSQNAFEKLNQAFLGQGIIIRVKSDTSPKKPIHLHFHSSLEGSLPSATHMKCFIQIEAGAKAAIIESFSGTENEKYFVNHMTDIQLQKNSNLEYVRMQTDSRSAFHIGTTRIFLQEQANLHSLSYQDGGAISRHNLDIYHIEKNSSSVVDGVYLCHGEQIIDNHTLIDHVVGNCQSSQLYKGIIDQKSKAIFNGKVLIRRGALKASSEQLNNNLLLSSTAEVDSKPELQIDADDVKATHGSTIGQLNPEEIFYFESRAIPKAKAIELLSRGFVFELIQKIENKQIASWLGDYLNLQMKVKNV